MRPMFVCMCVCVSVDAEEIGVFEHFDGGLFSTESTLPLSGEINANKGGEENWRSEGMTTKG